MSLLLLSLALASPPALAQDVLVTPLEGEAVHGELKQREFEITIDFGSAVVRADKLAHIEFGDPARVVTTGGLSFEGQLKIKRLRVETESGTQTLRVSDLRTLDVLVDGLAILRTGFSGSWSTSFGPMQLEQDGTRVTGTYGFQDEFVISGDVEGNLLSFKAKEPNGSSVGSFELWEDGDTFAGQFRFKDGDERFWGAYRLQPALATAEPGEITRGQSQSGLNYHLRDSVDTAARSEAEDLERRITENKDGSWVDDFWEFRRRFHFTPVAENVIAAYAGLREQHAAPAQKLFNAARGERDEDERHEKYAELLDRYYASKWYPLVKRWVK